MTIFKKILNKINYQKEISRHELENINALECTKRAFNEEFKFKCFTDLELSVLRSSLFLLAHEYEKKCNPSSPKTHQQRLNSMNRLLGGITIAIQNNITKKNNFS